MCVAWSNELVTCSKIASKYVKKCSELWQVRYHSHNGFSFAALNRFRNVAQQKIL